MSPTPSPTPATSFPLLSTDRAVTRADYGHKWPLTVEAGTLTCEWSYAIEGNRPLVTFDKGDGISYALNGAARDFGYPDADETIIKDYPKLTGLQPLIDDGLAICEANQ